MLEYFIAAYYLLTYQIVQIDKGTFINHVDGFLGIINPPPPCVDKRGV